MAKIKKNEILQRVETELQKLPHQHTDSLVVLAQSYFEDFNLEDLSSESIESLSGAIVNLWDFLSTRDHTTAKIDVYNPNFEEHGWHSTHTVVDVLTDDKPFIVSSLNMALVRLNHIIETTNHPILTTERDQNGELVSISKQENRATEALVRFQIGRISNQQTMDAIVQELEETLTEVDLVVEDWGAMQQRMENAIKASEQVKSLAQSPQQQEEIAFLRWAFDNNFTFIGFREYDLITDPTPTLKYVEHSALGTFRKSEKSHYDVVLNERLTNILQDHNNLLVLTKSTSVATVHRPVHLDYLGIKRFDKKGNVIGEWRFFGLYSSATYMARLQDIPLLRKKLDTILERAAVDPSSHKGKNLKHILNSYPRDEMLQAPVDELYDTIESILAIQERRQLRVFLRKDIYGRFLNVLVYVPRDRYNTELRMQMQEILMDACNGTSSEFNVQFSQQVLARVSFTIQIADPQNSLNVDIDDVQRKMQDAMLSWNDKLLAALHTSQGEENGNQLYNAYAPYLPAAYHEDFSPNTAVLDIERLNGLKNEGDIATHVYRQVGQTQNHYFFKVYGAGTTLVLSDVLPILECMGLRVLEARPYELDQNGDGQANTWIVEFAISVNPSVSLDKKAYREDFQNAFNQVFKRRIENDRFNSLVLDASLTWRQVTMLRAVTKYLVQLQVPFSLQYMQQTLEKNAPLARLLVQLFEQRFDPTLEDEQRGTKVAELLNNIETALDEVANLDEDRILKHYLSVIQAMLRTNFYQPSEEGDVKDYVSFKLDPSQIPAVPLPRPKFEVFVYAPWVEGVHMRGGKVARGGLRWSDRMEDFRTEVLGLVKAQMVKNAVIVPSGAKGGFVAKQLKKNISREEVQAEVVRCYTTFISGLLDITDNLVQSDVVPPRSVQRYDEDDPYLVVAADKGTATFSDLANSISEQYGFWLGDAFASGGSNGYDHKKMGITARGAWESVKRQFKEIGIDCQSTDFTAAGVGDMAGDVFGNGMLLSKHIRLIAAFNHMHIFIDPTPDAATSFEERQRLFNLPRSSWEDYNQELISKGGGIFSRSAKSIPINADIRKALGIEENVKSLAPTDLISHILKAPVDLLWNGGIGTYAKASSETHAEVGDSGNNSLRVNGNELRCKIIGEGGNLGFTQKARIEFAQNGGLVSTDAIDNAAGVDSSDHEVNIKILLNRIVENGDMTEKQRNTLLAEMTDEVAELVLRHNSGQSHLLSLVNSHAADRIADHWRLMRSLVREGRLNREIEFLPSDAQIKKRMSKGQGLTRPEISVLLAYSKIKFAEQLVDDGIDKDADLQAQIKDYFPTPLVERFSEHMGEHPLAAEIIAAHVTNNVGNRMGSYFTTYIQEETSCSALNVLRAYMAAEAIFDVPAIWQAINDLDFKVENEVLNTLQISIQSLLERATLWLIRNTRETLSIHNLIQTYQAPLSALKQQLDELSADPLIEKLQEQGGELIQNNVPTELAHSITALPYLLYGLDIVRVSDLSDKDVFETGQMYFALKVDLGLAWLRHLISELPDQNVWQRRAKVSLNDEVDASLRTILESSIEANNSVSKCLDNWRHRKASALTQYQSTLKEIKSENEVTLEMITVVISALRNLI